MGLFFDFNVADTNENLLKIIITPTDDDHTINNTSLGPN